MSDRVAAAAKVIAEYTNTEPDGVYATHLARALDDEGLLAPEMQEEWGVEIEGKLPDTWYQLNIHGNAPDHYADAAWLETREEAESLMEDVIAGEWHDRARIVRRYVTAAEKEEQ